MIKSLKELKQHGRTLRKHLAAAFQRDVTLSQAYEALAVAVGAPSWNSLSAQALAAAPALVSAQPVSTLKVQPTKPMVIRAVFRTVDGRASADFDAAPWFREVATQQDVDAVIQGRRMCFFPGVGDVYGGNSIADCIAEYFAERDPQVGKVYEYIASCNDEKFAGSDCWVSREDLEAWLADHLGVEQLGLRERTHNQQYQALVDQRFSVDRVVRDVDLGDRENVDVAKVLCERIFAVCIEEWQKPRTTKCEFLIESSSIYRGLDSLNIEMTGGDEGYHPTVESIVEDLLTEFGYYNMAKALYEGKATLPVAAPAPAEYSTKGMFNRLAILEVNLVDVLNEYELPDDTPEWQWVEKNSSFAHKGNGTDGGVWEFMVQVENIMTSDIRRASIPAPLKPFFEEAVTQKAIWILFHQG